MHLAEDKHFPTHTKARDLQSHTCIIICGQIFHLLCDTTIATYFSANKHNNLTYVSYYISTLF